MLIHAWDRGGERESLAFVRDHEFGQLVASGRDREIPVIVPTQFVLVDDRTVVLHLARANPVFSAIDENPEVVLSVVGDWSYIPAAWKAITDEDPAMGIPTTYYAAVQLRCAAEVVDSPDRLLDILRTQLGRYESGDAPADPAVHTGRLRAIRGIRLTIEDVRGKFKFGGNVDVAHRLAVAERLSQRDGPGDRAARGHLLRRIDNGRSR